MTIHRMLCAVTAALATVSPLALAPAMAQAAAPSFDVPAGALGQSLARIGRQAGVIVSVDPALVRGKRAAALRGTYSVAAALERVLAPSGLVAQGDGRGGCRVVAASAGAARSPAPRRATSVPLPAPIRADASDDEERSEPIVVVGALTDVALRHEDIEFRQANDLSDLFRQVPSVNVGGWPTSSQ